MTRHRLYRLLLAAATGLLISAPPSSAYADDGWLSPPCATGEITQRAVGLNGNGDIIIRLDGWSAVCGLAHSAGRPQFGLILYSSAGAWIGRLTEYQDSAPTPFVYHVNYTASTEALGGPPLAICLAYAEESRLSCVSVHSFAGNQPPTTDFIDIGNPIVARNCDGYCGNCVSDPGLE